MSFEALQNTLEIALARDELVREGISGWPRRIAPTLREVARGRRGPTVGDLRKSWDILRTVRFVEAHGLQQEPIVDLGAFSSEILCSLHLAGFRRLVGVDLNPRITAMPFSRAIEWRVGDMMSTGLPAGHFGAVLSISAIEHGFDARSVLREVSRLLRPGGYFVGSTDYWPEKIDTAGVPVFGMDWRIFSADEIKGFFELAAEHSLVPVGELNLSAQEPCIHFENRRYTFGWFALVKT